MSLSSNRPISFSELNEGIEITGGNVGIGTTAPSRRLDVNGGFQVSTSSDNNITFRDPVTNTSLDFTVGKRGSVQLGGWTSIDSNGGTSGSTGVYVYDAFEVGGTQTVGTSRITTNLVAVGNSNTVGNIFTTGGNMGIRTTSPSHNLHVVGDINFTGTLFQNGSLYGSQWTTINNNIVYTRGNVGINTTSTSDALLTINNNLTNAGIIVGTGATTSNIRIYGPFTDSWAYLQCGSSSTLGSLRICQSQTAGGTMGNFQVYSANMNFLGGNVGIGTSSPTSALNVRGAGAGGTIRIYPTTNGQEASIGFYASPTGGSWIMGQNSWSSGLNLAIGYNTTRHMTLMTGGNVGIGVDSPSVRLHVNGDIGLPYGSSIRVSPDLVSSWPSGTTKLIEAGWNINSMPGDVVSIYTPGSVSSVPRLNLSSNGRISVNGGLSVQSNYSVTHEGAIIQWNRSGGDGETWILNQRGGGNANAGIRLGAVDTSNNVTEWMRVNHSGNVGINITNPATRLHVNGGLQLGPVSSSACHIDVNGAFNFYSGSWGAGTFLGTWSTTGLGVGTASIAARLHVFEGTGTAAGANSGSIIIDHDNNGGASSITFRSKANRGSDFGYIQYQDATTVGGAGESARLILGTQNDSDDHICLVPSGNVGIGNSSPDALLMVGNRINDQAGSRSTIAVSGASSAPQITSVPGMYHRSLVGLGLFSDWAMTFQVGGGSLTEAMRITNGGRIGIGTTDPRYPLHVVGEASNSGDVTSFNFYINGPGVAGSTTYTEGFSARFSSRIIASEYWGTSDIRTKTDIQSIDDSTSLTILRNLEPKTFTFIDKLKNPNKVYGFIAQDLETVLPDAVVDSTDFIPNVYCSGTVTVTTGSSIVTLSKPLTNVFTYNNIEDDLRVRIICEKEEYIVKVVSVLDSTRFVVDKEITDTTVFVYGQEITDFKTVNKDVIAAVTTAAVQEIDRQLQQECIKIENMETEIETLESETILLQSQFVTLEQQYEDLVNRVTSLESQ